MKLIEFIGLARSGHHAMMNWFFKNMIGLEYNHEYQVNVFGDSGWTHWNDSTIFFEQSLKSFTTLDKPNILSISYDNVEWEYSHINKSNSPFHKHFFNGWQINQTYKIVFIRDFYNNLVSRKKMFHNLNEPRAFYDEKFIDVWKNHARACVENKVFYIKYEDWLSNKNKRVELLGHFNVTEKFDNSKVSGTPSSFGNSKDYLKRFDKNEISEEIKNLIKEDNELHYLIGKLGYEFRKL